MKSVSKLCVALYAGMAVFCMLMPVRLHAQTHSPFPVNIVTGMKPWPVMADGKSHLLYELYLTNFYTQPIAFNGFEIRSGKNDSLLAEYRHEELEKLLVTVGPADSTSQLRVIGGGRSVTIFIDLQLKPGMPPPANLHHRFSLSITFNNGHTVEQIVNGPAVAVVQDPPLVLQPPLRGNNWIAFNGLSTGNHRRTMLTIDGRVHIAQRFAIDWMQLGPDRRLFHDGPTQNTHFYCYGADVLAVGNGRVVDLKDEFPDHEGGNDESSRHTTLENVLGNYLVLDLGQGQYAVYAHLKLHSFKVKPGDRVNAGAVLAQLGNSGNSDMPHLHFHLVNANAPVNAEGLPYELKAFTQTGTIGNQEDALDNGEPWQPETKKTGTVRRKEFPVNNAVVSFP